jgi:PBP1b-binding outer membrane lipoprotein LpoB
LLVENNEASIHSVVSCFAGDIDSINMTARFVRCLKQSDVMIVFKEASTAEPGNAGTNNSDFHVLRTGRAESEVSSFPFLSPRRERAANHLPTPKEPLPARRNR